MSISDSTGFHSSATSAFQFSKSKGVRTHIEEQFKIFMNVARRPVRDCLNPNIALTSVAVLFPKGSGCPCSDFFRTTTGLHQLFTLPHLGHCLFRSYDPSAVTSEFSFEMSLFSLCPPAPHSLGLLIPIHCDYWICHRPSVPVWRTQPMAPPHPAIVGLLFGAPWDGKASTSDGASSG
jgi:hypothetical protein